MMAVAYEWHNYGKSTIGNRTDIERVPIDKLQAFYQQVLPARQRHARRRRQVRRSQGARSWSTSTSARCRSPTRKLDETYTEEPPQDGERSVTLRRVGDVGVVAALYHVPAGRTRRDIAALDVLASILGSPPSGRLYKALVETKKATDVAASASSWHDPGVFEVEAEVRKGDSLEAARDIMFEVTEKAGDTPFTEEEVERAKQQLLKQRELAAADTSRIAVQLSEWAAQGDWRLYFLHRDRIEKVTPERSAGRGQAVPAPREPHAGHVHSHRQVGEDRDSRDARIWPSCSTATRVARRSPRARRSTSRRPTSRPAASALTLPEGIKAVAAAEEDARRDRQPAAGACATARLESLKGYRSGRRASCRR